MNLHVACVHIFHFGTNETILASTAERRPAGSPEWDMLRNLKFGLHKYQKFLKKAKRQEALGTRLGCIFTPLLNN